VTERFEELEEERQDIESEMKELQDERDAFTMDEDDNLAPDGPGYSNNAEAWAGENAADAEKLEDLEQSLKDWDEENGEEFATLKEMLEDLAGAGGDHDWRGDWYPVTLIRDSYFVDAMRELVQDIGDMPREIPSYIEIDWEKTADNLRADYSSIEYDGVTYWYR
jgi:hypothetical protein